MQGIKGDLGNKIIFCLWSFQVFERAEWKFREQYLNIKQLLDEKGCEDKEKNQVQNHTPRTSSLNRYTPPLRRPGQTHLFNNSTFTGANPLYDIEQVYLLILKVQRPLYFIYLCL